MGRRHTETDSDRQRKKEKERKREGERRDVYMSGITNRLAIYTHEKAQTSDSCRQHMQDVMHIKPDRNRLVWMIKKLSMNANYSAALCDHVCFPTMHHISVCAHEYIDACCT